MKKSNKKKFNILFIQYTNNKMTNDEYFNDINEYLNLGIYYSNIFGY